MDSYQYLILFIASVIAWLMIVDPNIAEYMNLIFKIMGVNFQRFLWMMKYHPNNFVTTWVQNRKYDKIARELQEELIKGK